MDTPGAGDLEEKRAQIIGDALRGSDGAIITVSAENAMSMSEKLFIEERLISKKTPFMMLILTKLDRIPENQRSRIIDFVHAKLQTWNMDIPVYVPGEVSIPGDRYNTPVGTDKIKATINSWISSPERQKLTNAWIASKAVSVIESSVSALEQQRELMSVSEDERRAEIEKREEGLAKARAAWAALRDEMELKSDEAVSAVMARAEEYKKSIIEKLQYEISHTSNLQNWWENDYPYKVKVELTSMSSALEAMLVKKYNQDCARFNSELEKNFKTHILASSDISVQKHDYTPDTDSQLDFGDIGQKRTKARIGVSVVSIVGYLLFASCGIPPIIASTGVSTGGGILTEKFFRKKTDDQRVMLKTEVENNFPITFRRATANTRTRIKKLYTDVIKESIASEASWLEARKEAISRAVSKNSEESKQKLSDIITTLNEHKEIYQKLYLN